MVGRGRSFLAIAQPRTPPVRRKDHRDISYTSRFMADFVLNFVTMATVFVEVGYVWRQSIARPRKPPDIRKDLLDISYTSRVI